MDLITVYATKYLFTKGIVRIDGCEVYEGEYATRGAGTMDRVFLRLGQEAHRTMDEAVRHAGLMCARKMRSLERQRALLLALLETLGQQDHLLKSHISPLNSHHNGR